MRSTSLLAAGVIYCWLSMVLPLLLLSRRSNSRRINHSAFLKSYNFSHLGVMPTSCGGTTSLLGLKFDHQPWRCLILGPKIYCTPRVHPVQQHSPARAEIS